MADKTFSQDVEFLQQHVDTIVLGEPGGPQIAVVPQYQGRTMTSTAGGPRDTSYAWINYELIESGKKVPQINLYGGEDRFWLSPEGGQFSVFFDPGAPMDFAVWRVPDILDTQPFELTNKTEHSASFQRQASVANHSNYEFQIQFDRTVDLLNTQDCEKHLDASLDGLSVVGHESQNTLTNTGDETWNEKTGLLGIWMLCMNKPSPKATVIVPFRAGDAAELGPIVNADYFGKLDESRLKIDQDRSLIYFLGDGQLRSKLGLTFSRVRSFLGSWDPALETLTVCQFNLPESVEHGYTNNLWEIQDAPYDGDVINSYNDGPNESGGMLGPFFELETISPALKLAPQENYCHIHRTIRMQGNRNKINDVANKVFGVGLDVIEQQFG